LDAYNQKLVKKIAVRGISVKGQGGTDSYLYLENIEISKKAPKACIEMEEKQATGKVVKKRRKIGKGDNIQGIQAMYFKVVGLMSGRITYHYHRFKLRERF
jgi:type III restriction enzyme